MAVTDDDRADRLARFDAAQDPAEVAELRTATDAPRATLPQTRREIAAALAVRAPILEPGDVAELTQWVLDVVDAQVQLRLRDAREHLAVHVHHPDALPLLDGLLSGRCPACCLEGSG